MAPNITGPSVPLPGPSISIQGHLFLLWALSRCLMVSWGLGAAVVRIPGVSLNIGPGINFSVDVSDTFYFFLLWGGEGGVRGAGKGGNDFFY